jgi:UDP-N-acetylglucosamine 3-dehydrogenase
MSQEIGIGIIGAGVMGGQYFSKLVTELSSARLVAVADIDERRAQEVGARYNIPAYKDCQQLIERKDVDAVLVTTPDKDHLEPSKAAAQAGKHLFVEKPLATVVREAQEIVNTAKENSVILMVGHSLRFDPRVARMQEAASSGQLGEIFHLHARRNAYLRTGRKYSQSSTLAFFLAVHDGDMMNWVTGSQVMSVYSRGVSKVLKGMGGPDSIFSILQFESGAIGCIENCWVLPEIDVLMRPHAFEVVGTEGMAFLAFGEQGLSIYTKELVDFPDVINGSMLHGKTLGAYKDEIAHFVDCVLYGRQPAVTGADGLAAVKVAVAIEQSLASGQEVELK